MKVRISAIDRDELILALLEGALETPLWNGFLRRLCVIAGADHASLTFRPPGKSAEEALQLYSGDLPQEFAGRLAKPNLPSFARLNELTLQEGRLYRFDRSRAPSTNMDVADHIALPDAISAVRIIRIQEKSGVDAWLTLALENGSLDEASDRLLTELAPMLRAALQTFVALERERFKASVTSDGMRRLYFAWMALDQHGHLLECDPEVENVFTQIDILSRSPVGRLNIRPASLDRDIHEAIRHLAANPQAKARAFTLNWEPWLDIVLLPARRRQFSVGSDAAVIAYLHGDSWHASDRCDQLVQLFGLTRGEARLALSLSRGLSIEEAATKFGLKIDTARKYSKIIYSKTGARGMPDLVRIVMRSVLALAPDR